MTNPTGSTPGSEGEGTWRVVEHKEEDWYVERDSGDPLSVMSWQMADYLNALTRKAAAYDEAVKHLKAMHEAYTNMRDYHEEDTDTLYEAQNEGAEELARAFLSSLEGGA